MTMHILCNEKLSHHKWRSLVKSRQRQKKRRKFAATRDEKLKEELKQLSKDPDYVRRIEEQEALSLEALKIEEEEARVKKQEWIAKDLALHSLFLKKKEKTEKLLLEKKLQEEKLKKEFECNLQKESSSITELETQEALLNEARSKLSESKATHNPEPPEGYRNPSQSSVVTKEVDPCPFFVKTGACRFGARCSRLHEYPSSGRTLLLTNMYSHFGADGGVGDDYDTDLSLEYSEAERSQHFRDFYFDVLREFRKEGTVVQFKVCCNKSSHLKGNVYVQYKKERYAVQAVKKFNGRWYAGKQLACLIVPITSWKMAICGLYWSNRCPKGNQCNFLHVYQNPNGEFADADRDIGISSSRKDSPPPASIRRNRRTHERCIRSHGRRSRSQSRSPYLRVERKRRKKIRKKNSSSSDDSLSRNGSRRMEKNYSSDESLLRNSSRRKEKNYSSDESMPKSSSRMGKRIYGSDSDECLSSNSTRIKRRNYSSDSDESLPTTNSKVKRKNDRFDQSLSVSDSRRRKKNSSSNSFKNSSEDKLKKNLSTSRKSSKKEKLC